MRIPPLESVFVNPSPVPDSRELGRVLVIGGDETGREMARRLAQEGFDVVLVGDGGPGQGLDGVSVIADSCLEEARGFVGGFDAVVSASGKRSVERVGFIVAAAPARRVPKYEEYQLKPSGEVVSLSALEMMLGGALRMVSSAGEWMHVVFLCGIEGDSDTAHWVRVLDAVEKLSDRTQTQTYVFTRQVKVAGPGLERRYREARQRGTLFFKFDGQGPEFVQDDRGVTIVFKDPLLGLDMEIEPDLLVVDEHHLAPASLKPLMDLIPSSSVASPFLQPESPRFTGVETAKAGIFAVGPARGKFAIETIARDIEAALEALKTWPHRETRPMLPAAPQIDRAKCTVCLTCVRLCPHGAMSFRSWAEADPMSCVRCGICAAECPANAISLPPADGEGNPGERARPAHAAEGVRRRITAFLCARSAVHAMESTPMRVRANIMPVIVPCAGTIDIGRILDAFLDGAYGVLAAGCHKGNCASVYGTILAEERAARARSMLEEAGIDPNRLLFVTLASNTPGDFARAVGELESRLL